MKTNQLAIFPYALCGAVLAALAFSTAAYAQSDSTLNRSVTVERDFQPVIQAAGKVATRPAVVETEIPQAEVEYSDFTVDLHPEPAFRSLLPQASRFERGYAYNGYVRGGLGHANTLFDFGYHLDDGKRSILDVYAHHRAQWGMKALSRTKVGFDFTHPFSNSDLYFGVNGGNLFYHKYGHFYDYSQVNPSAWTKDKTSYPGASFGPQDKTSLWSVEAYIGIKANAKQDFQYRAQTGYVLFAKPGAVSEHQIRTHASFDWKRDVHHVGLQFYMQNNFLQLGSLSASIADSLYNGRHNFRIEPYYAYQGSRVQLHIGVNLDMNVGKGTNSLSSIDNLTFAPSPHIHLEAQIAQPWLTLYADVHGSHGTGSLQAFMEANRYRLIHAGITSQASSVYTPVDAELGFHIRPRRDLLIELHGGYALSYYNLTLIAVTDSAVFKKTNTKMQAGDFAYADSHLGCGKIGGQINWHYQDIVRVNLHGDYYFWSVLENKPCGYTFYSTDAALASFQSGTNTTVYDRAKWELGLRVDGRIDRHWSLYSDNYFAGSRTILATDGEHTLRPTVELDLGVQYEMWVGKPAGIVANDKGSFVRPLPQPNLILFFQLNNFIHRKNDIYYGYRSEGINFLLGATFRF